MRTLAKEPPVFEIPGFLSAEECEHIKKLALEVGLFRSPLKQDGANDETEEEGSAQELFHDFDTNQDGVLDVHEVLEILDLESNVFLRPEDASQMFQEVHLDVDGDGALSLDEFSSVDSEKIIQIKEWAGRLSNDDKKLSRVSQQAWLSQDDGTDKILTDLRQRTTELTGLPAGIVEHSEKLQVVYYTPGGHFHAHYDSEEIDPNQRCSHTAELVPDKGGGHDTRSTRLCRFLTILYYLDDTMEGGETAFPIADNATFSEENVSVETCDLSRHCHEANLYVTPEKGKAVMWYNHYINETTGWLGSMNPYSLHGGCDVIQGTKWIANNWITVDNSYQRQMLYMKEMGLLKLSHRSHPLLDVDDDLPLDPEEADFTDTVYKLKEIWMEYLQNSAGKDALGKYFGSKPSLEDAVDQMMGYTFDHVAEIHLAHNGNEVEYNIVWRTEMDQTATDELDDTDLSSLIQTASAYGRGSGSGVNKMKPSMLRIYKNPRYNADGSKITKQDKVETNLFEKRMSDEL
ncbi:transmembrane prolyl 4-hydroxylase-like isoform X2 [Acanthaster planci]|nr:transmembrane prolyl 4-hydroxylase-like isoform X2 [Acanthaster planci]